MLDIKIAGGQLIDGTGAPARGGDLGIAGDAIAEIGDLSREPAGRTLSAAGLAVMPGFIDMHSHSDWRLWSGSTRRRRRCAYPSRQPGDRDRKTRWAPRFARRPSLGSLAAGAAATT